MFGGIIYSGMRAGRAEWEYHAPPAVSEGLLQTIPHFRSEIIGLNVGISDVQYGYLLLTTLLKLPEEGFNSRAVVKLYAVELRV